MLWWAAIVLCAAFYLAGQVRYLHYLWLRLRWHEAADRYAQGRCVQCGYDLTGNVSGVCPECGGRLGGA